MQCPNSTKLARDVVVGCQDRLQLSHGFRRKLPCNCSFLQNAPGVPDEPVVLVKLHFDQFRVGEFSQVEVAERFGLTKGRFVNSSTAAIGAIIVVAFSEVIPIRSEYSTIG